MQLHNDMKLSFTAENEMHICSRISDGKISRKWESLSLKLRLIMPYCLIKIQDYDDNDGTGKQLIVLVINS